MGGYAELLNINGYVLVLLEYCLWFYLVYLGRRFYNERTANLLLIGGVIVSSVLSYFIYYPASVSSARAAWPFERWGLVWGVLLFTYFVNSKELVKPTRSKIALLLTACLILGIAYLKYKTVYFWGEYLLKIVLGFAIITQLFTLSSKRSFGNKASFFLGGISYEVYLSHGFIMHVLDKNLPNLPSGVFILATVMITILYSAIIHSIGKPIVKKIRA